ncbi:hypothetical protein LCGC14_2653290 [marine sediment metagenome]|uniref:Uncharacterized protein n=1 Tax=marine sediment metagenome TaxID=412755 RepID=A0A0F9C4K8_9ZZZZ
MATEDTQVKETELVIEKGEDAEIKQTALKMESAGYSYIYDPKTGDRSVVNNNMRLFNLNKKNPDGSPRFVGEKPKNPPEPLVRGTYKCVLHKDDPDRVGYAAMGFPTCPKDDLASPYQVIRHAEKRHKSEWADIKYKKEEAQKEEDRALQRAILANMRGKPVEEKPAKGTENLH